MKPPSNGHSGTNINSSGFSPVERLSSLRGTNHNYIDRGIKFGDLVLSIVIHCPFIGGSSLRDSEYLRENCYFIPE